MSDRLARALIGARPAFATSEAEALRAIRAQFPSDKSIPSHEFLAVLRQVLKTTNPAGDIPLTLIVLDELQQFIGDDKDRANEVSELVEACCSEFRSRILFVGAGQMALGATPILQKLLDRYTVTIGLQDRDMDRVVRSVVLRKRPERMGDLEEVLDRASGEISRQLAGSAIAPVAADRDLLAADYPLLPSRRRLWERFLRAVDTAGRAGQLRTQMRVVLDATRNVAARDLGVVVAADRIYDEQESAMQQTGVLLPTTAQLIQDAAAVDGCGPLGTRVAKAIFILGKLPTEGPNATGLSATNDVIADLLIEDLLKDGPVLRERVPKVTRALFDAGKVLEVDGAYLLQTPEAAEWEAEYQAHARALRTDTPWQADMRADVIREAFAAAARSVKPKQGTIERKVRVGHGSEQPKGEAGEVVVWVRDGWGGTSEREVREDAQRLGTDNPTVLVWIPNELADEIKSAMVEAQAAKDTVDLRAIPTSEDGRNARAGMITRRDLAAARLADLAKRVIGTARVYQAGGNDVAEPVGNPELVKSLAKAAGNAVLRMFPDFEKANDSRWSTVIQRAKGGASDALAALGYTGDAAEHPVAKPILAFVGPAGKRGAEVRAQFEAPPYGWPQDAIDGSLLALLAAQKLLARRNGEPTTAAPLTQNVISTVEFKADKNPPTAEERMRVKGLAVDLDIPTVSVGEAELASKILTELRSLSDRAGGEAPLPNRPRIDKIRDLEGENGSDLVRGVAGAKDELKVLAADWKAQAAKIPSRLASWRVAERLIHHADGLPIAVQATATMAAIERERTLLSEPDPVAPVVTALADVLRGSLNDRVQQFEAARSAEIAKISGAETWADLDESARNEYLGTAGLAEAAKPALGTTTELLDALDEWPLADWQVRLDAIAVQVGNAYRLAVAEQTLAEPGGKTPVAVAAPKAVIRTPADLDRYLETLRKTIAERLDAGDTVVI